ncbi:unnamed protein product [Cyclocybe aegerita]|uniref:Uncharacterized protein n=1 Tax=Cyclocybe aegerita TaxID=1973307 RepID=A0A8S0WTQ8_CYCAE|nr:unnamed protein product [Cyclocybe aegerita]
MFAKLLSLSLLSLLPITAFASHGNPLLNRHHEIAKRAEGHVDLFKRVSNSKWSYYNVQTGNAGSCGKYHVNSDFTVAMNAVQMNSGLCFKTIRLSYGGKTTTATISDTCPGCPWGGLDLTEGLFAFFAPHSVGIIYGEWDFTDAAPAPPPAPTTTKRRTTTSTWTPPPTTTWVPPPPPPAPTTTSSSTRRSSSRVSSSTTSRASSSSLSSSSSSTSSAAPTSSINYSSGAASGLAVPTGSLQRTPGQTSNLADLNQVFIQVGGVVAAGAQV